MVYDSWNGRRYNTVHVFPARILEKESNQFIHKQNNFHLYSQALILASNIATILATLVAIIETNIRCIGRLTQSQ